MCYSKSRNLLATCGEDGLVRVWDCRQSLSKCTKQFNPGSHQMTRRKEKYLSSISMRDDWLACGGGPAMALWHIGAEEPASLLDLGIGVNFLKNAASVFARYLIFQNEF